MLTFGRDNATVGFADFHILVSNPTDEIANFTINYIRDAFGNPIKTMPRRSTWARASRACLPPRVVDSLGLQLGETHPFAAHFGDVFLTSSMADFRMNLSLGNNLRRAAPVRPRVARVRVRRAPHRDPPHRLRADARPPDLARERHRELGLALEPDERAAAQRAGVTRALSRHAATEYILTTFKIPPQSIFRFRGDALR